MNVVLFRTTSATSCVRNSGLASSCTGLLSLHGGLPQQQQQKLNSGAPTATTRAFSTHHHQHQQQHTAHLPLGMASASSSSPRAGTDSRTHAFIPQTETARAPLPAPAPTPAVYEVLFVRHGQSSWNRDNRFIGWTDCPLTEKGEEEAMEAGRVLAALGVQVDEVHTSLLKRCIKTAWTILGEIGQEHVPVHCHWRLNERSYGALVGKDKKETVAEHGVEQVRTWRRSYDVRPPPQSPSSEYWPGRDQAKYGELLASGALPAIPVGECLKDVKERAAAHWEEVVVPAIKAGKRVVVVGHENNLRALFMHIDQVAPEDMLHVEIPRATPLRYQFDADMRPVPQPEPAPFLSGQFLISAERVAAIKERDLRQVYDLKVTTNLELEAATAMVAAAAAGTSASSSKTTQQAAPLAPQEEAVAAAAAAAASPPRRRERLQTWKGLSNARSQSRAFWLALQDELAGMPVFAASASTTATTAAAAAGASGGAAFAKQEAPARLPKMLKSVLSLLSVSEMEGGMYGRNRFHHDDLTSPSS